MTDSSRGLLEMNIELLYKSDFALEKLIPQAHHVA